MNEMVNPGKIDPLKLDRNDYFSSLLNCAHGCGEITDSQFRDIQVGSIAFLSKLAERYNNGSGSSIQIDTAGELMSSLFFTVGAYLKTAPSCDAAVKLILENSIDTLYDRGNAQLHKLMNITRHIHSRIKHNLFETDNTFYSETLIDGISGFFKLYNPEFFARDIHITADYPTAVEVKSHFGIEFIREYTEYLCCENDFCRNFSSENVHLLLSGYDSDYADIPMNIFEPVLSSALGCVIIESDAAALSLTVSDVNALYCSLCTMSKARLGKLLLSAADELTGTLSLADSTAEYIKKAMPKITAQIYNALKLDSPETVFIVPRNSGKENKLVCSFGQRSDNESYAEITALVMEADSPAEKAAAVRDNITSLADFDDIVTDAELEEPEIMLLLGDLSAVQLAAFAKKYEIFSDFTDENSFSGKYIFISCVKKMIEALPENQAQQIKDAARRIIITD